MKDESKRFFRGVFFGAMVGGAITLLDKETRSTVVGNVKRAGSNMAYYIKNPNVVVDQVKDTINHIKSTIEQVSDDVSFIAEKVEELKEMTPAVTEIVKDTQEAFHHTSDDIETETENKPF